MNQAPVAEVSTATVPAPPVQPETTQAPVTKKLTLHERHEQALQQFRKNEGLTPEEKPAEVVEGQENPTEEAKVEEPAPETESEFVDKVKFGEAEAPIEDVLKDATFEFQSANGLREVEGIDKLMKYASIGYDASLKNQTAKQAILEAQNIIKEIEAEQQTAIRTGVSQQLDMLLETVLKGNNPETGKPYENPADRARAVDVAQRLQRQNATGNSAGETPVSQTDLEKLVEKKLQEITKAEGQKRQDAERQAGVEKTAQENLKRVTDPLKQFFLEDDGKTLNSEIWDSFLLRVQQNAAADWAKAGAPKDAVKINGFVEGAAKSTFERFKKSLNIKQPEAKGNPKQPQIKPTGGGGVPQSNAKPPKGMSYDQSVAWHKARLGLK